MDFSEVMVICEKIRKLFKENGKEVDFLFSDFPEGCCGIISLLIGIYLEEHGFGVYDYVCGELENGATHAWLEKDALIIDITLDQFGKQYPPMYVGYDRSYYEMFAELEIRPYKTSISDEDYIYYSKMITRLK